jgi:acetoin utilization protein AcuC
MQTAALIWNELLARYQLRPGHPLNPRRLELTISLMEAYGLFPVGRGLVTANGGRADADDGTPVGESARTGSAVTPATVLASPRPATEAELLRAHSPEYVAAVRRLSEPGASPASGLSYGLGTEDTPIVEGMHDIAALVVGGTLVAAELVMNGVARRAFNPAGGLHHAHHGAASGFCVYNDLAVAIRWIQQEFGARVMYIDYDAHHGDGVQGIFYNDPDVLTVSFHESGIYLFPATGYVNEMGAGDGYGYSVNVPLEAGTEDDSWRAAFTTLVPELAAAFRPDVIVLQNGCDGHALDPLAHLRATTGLFEEFVKLVCQVADTCCQGRIIATGGGGYAIYEVVPRAWTLVWAALAGLDAPDAIPERWLEKARQESGTRIPAVLRDPAGAYGHSPNKASIDRINDLTVRAVRAQVMPILTGWGLGF